MVAMLAMLLMAVATPLADAQMNLRMRVQIADVPAGVFLVYDACSSDRPVRPGVPYVAYWHDYGTQQLYVFGRVLFDKTDVAYALLNLERDLGADAVKLGAASFSLADALVKTASKPADATLWKPAIYEDVREIMDPNWNGGGGSNAVMGPGGIGPSPRPFSPIGRCLHGPMYSMAPVVPPPPDPTCDTLIAMAFNFGDCPGVDKPPPDTGCQGDIDCDGTPDGQDDDMDGDGIPNSSDGDMDGDGTSNGNDRDTDGDGVGNDTDDDNDGDGIPNGDDNDIDHDGIPNGQDNDMDGDGEPNDTDTDTDGDGLDDGDDPTPNGCTDCMGACCVHPTGACNLKNQSDCNGPNETFQGTDYCYLNPCCPAGINNVFPPGAATILQVPLNAPLDALDWGQTRPETIGFEDIQISAQCDGMEWCPVMTDLKGRYSYVARLLSCTSEVTGPNGNTTESNHCDQVTLLYLGGGPGCPLSIWYMLSAVEAHEDVHLAHIFPALQLAAPSIEMHIESVQSICFPHIPGMTESEAIAQIQSLEAYQIALANATQLWKDAYSILNSGEHNGPAYDAEIAVVDPMIDVICMHAKSECWEYCLVCPPHPTGACCDSADGSCTPNVTRCDCQDMGAGFVYKEDGSTCGPPNPWVGACCGPPPEYPCTITTENNCGGLYRGDGTVCTPNPCEPPI